MAPPLRTAEHERIASAPAGRPGEWKAIGPFVSERAWGTVREDYSADGKAWQYFPYEHGRSRAYRWNEDGLAGLCDLDQRMCFALAFWNGRDPFLKERIFGLSGPEGNHGEDAKEYWWYADATPTSSWLSWRYHYPQAEFPYARLREENARRGRHDREFELADTGIFDGGRYWQITVDYAKAAPRDLCVRIRARNAGPEAAELHVLPTLWFRNRWSWDEGAARPVIHAAADDPGSAIAEEERLGRWRLTAGRDPSGALPRLLFCENETNAVRLFGAPALTPYPKDGINDHVVAGAKTVNPAQRGTKLACWYRITVRPGATARAAPASDPGRGTAARPRVRLRPHARRPRARGRRVLRRAPPRRRHRRRSGGHAPGARRHGLEPAVLSLRRRALARGRSDAAGAAGGAQDRAERRVAAPEQPRHPRDARQVGIPVVRRVGPRVPLRRARADRSGGGEAPAAPDVPRVVHAPERPAARLRVELRRREPAGPGVGGARGVPDRRRDRLRLPGARLPQAADQLHLVGEPQGHARRQHLRGRLPRARQHRAVRPLGDAARAARCSSSPTAPRGWRSSASTCSRWRCASPTATARTRASR